MKKLVIANRGEIARRVLRSGKDNNFKVAVISVPSDADAPVREEADIVLEVNSFLNIKSIVKAAKEWGATHLHPGYGFLSENAEFAKEVERAGISFVGPTSENMTAMGGKESAKGFADACDVPTLNSLTSEALTEVLKDEEKLKKALGDKGIISPYLVKASAGGGGRGMRVVRTLSELPAAVELASSEALAGFGDGTVFVERYLEKPRHIEIQVFGDGEGGGVAFGERECSLQRRHQKVIEEAPSPSVTTQLRQEMGHAALRLVQATQYRGAGTVEFLLDTEGRFYFLEMNTRLQVEHPVTEEVYGVDLVDAQLDLATGLWPSQFPEASRLAVLEPKGWSIEARILAEDPAENWMPTPGDISLYREPSAVKVPGARVRFDSGVKEGGRVNADFDSMIAKLVVSGRTREQARQGLVEALENTVIHGGCRTNIGFLHHILSQEAFATAAFWTTWIEENQEELTSSKIPQQVTAIMSSRGFREQMGHYLLGGRAIESQVASQLFSAGATAKSAYYSSLCYRIIRQGRHRFRLEMGSQDSLRFYGSVWQKKALFSINAETLQCDLPQYEDSSLGGSGDGKGLVSAPMAGRVLDIRVSVGGVVEEGQVVAIVESMKMQLEVKAPCSGSVESVFVEVGQSLTGPDPILQIISEVK